MKTIVIIQARMGSTRLPGKVLMSLGKKCVLHYVVARCKEIEHVSNVIVATSTLDADDLIAKWCNDNHIACFRGSEEDVLSRYYECASIYEPDYIIRATSDCPFLDYDLANQSISLMREQRSDILLLSDEIPRGLAVEVISYAALKRIYELSTEVRHREHVTYFAYEYLDQFEYSTLNVSARLRHPRLRLTLDTIEDYLLCQAVQRNFSGWPYIPAEKIIDFLLCNPKIAQYNAHIEQKPVL